MAEIIFVHGIAQEQLSADALEKDWLPGLAGGVRTAGFPKVADRIWRNSGSAHPDRIEARMAFYGGLFLKPGQMSSGGEEIPPDELPAAEALAEAWLERAAEAAKDHRDRRTAQQELAELRPEAGVERQGIASRVGASTIREPVQVAAWFAPFGMGTAQRFVNRSLSQVTRHTWTTIRSARRPSEACSSSSGPRPRSSSATRWARWSLMRQRGPWIGPGIQPLPLLLTLRLPVGHP